MMHIVHLDKMYIQHLMNTKEMQLLYRLLVQDVERHFLQKENGPLLQTLTLYTQTIN